MIPYDVFSFFSKQPDVKAPLIGTRNDSDISEEGKQAQEAVMIGSPTDQDMTDVQALDEAHPDKTLLENYGYNAFMTFFQDIPQTIATVAIMATKGLHKNPDNPTGVSLPGYLDLIPQFGNAAAGLAAATEAYRLSIFFKHNPSPGRFSKAALYTIFSLSTVLNGVTNIINIFDEDDNDELTKLARITTLLALSANFIILCKEEIELLKKSCTKESSAKWYEHSIFHLVTSINLNISIITSSLATVGLVDRNVGAYGYLWGTWMGQIPELIKPTIDNVKCQFKA